MAAHQTRITTMSCWSEPAIETIVRLLCNIHIIRLISICSDFVSCLLFTCSVQCAVIIAIVPNPYAISVQIHRDPISTSGADIIHNTSRIRDHLSILYRQ